MAPCCQPKRETLLVLGSVKVTFPMSDDQRHPRFTDAWKNVLTRSAGAMEAVWAKE